MMEFLNFGKHTAYIAWAFGITFAVLIANVLVAYRAYGNALRAARAAREED